MEIKDVIIEIRPESRSAGGRTIFECRIEVKVWGKEKYTLVDMIPEDDFKSRFDWIMERATRLLKDKMCC